MYFNSANSIQMLLFLSSLTALCIEARSRTEYANKPHQLQHTKPAQNVVAEMQVICHSDAILLKMNTNTPFNGMVYARGEPHSSACVSEFNSATNMTFRLPLKACGTLFSEVDDGIEYFNTVVVQPHMRLMTNQGKGYHIRCKYQTRERTIANTQFNVSASFHMQDAPKSTTPILATASMPSCTMKIFRKGRSDIAESVKIGDKLVMVIEIDRQDMYGMRISNCVVRDGLNVAEQLLIDNIGCPLDETIMPSFEYSNNYTRAAVSFPAHKFPHTSSVYYQCNISLCINNGNCIIPECKQAQAGPSQEQPQLASGQSAPGSPANALQASASNINVNNQAPTINGVTSQPSGSRRKRHSNHPNNNLDHQQQNADPPNGKLIKSGINSSNNNSNNKVNGDTIDRFDDMSFDVYSGLYVNDATDEDPIYNDTDEINSSATSRSSNVKTTSLATTTTTANGDQLQRQNQDQEEQQNFGIYDLVSSISQKSMTFLLVALGSVALMMALLFQIGLIGRSSIGQQVPSSSAVQLTHSRRHDQQVKSKNHSNPLSFHCYDCNS